MDIHTPSKIFLRLILIYSIFLFNSCDGDTSDDMSVNKSDNCFVHEAEILVTPGSFDAPKLNMKVGIETGDRSLDWNEISDVLYYELEESLCPDFSTSANVYHLNKPGFKSDSLIYTYYYRIRAVLPNSTTGWSNVVKY